MTQRLPRPIADEAFPLWLELVGVDPAHFDERERAFGGTTTWRELDAAQRTLTIHECLAIPDDELTAQLLLAKALALEVADSSVSMAEMLKKPSAFQRKMDLVQRIQAIFDREPLVRQRAGFSGQLQDALAHYGAGGRDDVQALIEDDVALAQLRRDAWFGLEQIQMNQFLEGDAGTGGKPGYNRVIRRWWCLEDLLAAHTQLPEGVSLNLVCPSVEHDLFFCFVVRRGAKLYLLHDAPEHEHPLQSVMSRRPDRALAARMAKFWFPYETAGVSLSDDGREAGFARDAERGLALPGRWSRSSQVVAQLSDLPPEELVWLVLMFGRLMDRFWTQPDLPALPLSFAAAHLRPETPSLLEDARAAGLPVVFSPLAGLAVPPITAQDVATLHERPEGVAALGEVGPVKDRQWLLDRYGPRVPEAALNLVAGREDSLVRLTHEGDLETLDRPDHEALRTARFFGEDRAMTTFHQLEATHFGTPEQLQADRRFLARANYAKAIDGMAEREYDERREDVQRWLMARYTARRDFLLSLAPAAAAGELTVMDWKPGLAPDAYEFKVHAFEARTLGPEPKGQGYRRRGDRRAHAHALGVVAPIKTQHYSAPTALMATVRRDDELKARRFDPKCHITGAKPTYWFAVRPTNAVELAWLLGLTRDELPDVLREHNGLTHACGNQILDRIDPVLWALDNPWLKLDLGVRLALSKRGLAQLQKQAQPVDLSTLQGASLAMFRGEPLKA